MTSDISYIKKYEIQRQSRYLKWTRCFVILKSAFTKKTSVPFLQCHRLEKQQEWVTDMLNWLMSLNVCTTLTAVSLLKILNFNHKYLTEIDVLKYVLQNGILKTILWVRCISRSRKHYNQSWVFFCSDPAGSNRTTS